MGQKAVSRIADTSGLDSFFAAIPEENTYKKIYVRFKKKIRKEIEKYEEDDEVEDILNGVVSVLEEEFLKKTIIAIYRGIKNQDSSFEKQLLPVVNQYLINAGFYSRDDIDVGDLIKDKDFNDMDIIKDSQTLGKRHGEITEIEMYPYYLNYIDENEEKRKVHTQGKMIVIA